MSADLTDNQQFSIALADLYMHGTGLPTYTELLAMLEKHTRPLPAGQTITLPAGDEFAEPHMDTITFLAEHPELKP